MKIPKDHATLIDVQYVKANRQKELPDYLYIIWKDQVTGEKYLEKIPEPGMNIYFEKPEFRNHNHNKTWERLEHLDKKVVKYSRIIPEIAKEMGQPGMDYLNKIYSTGDYGKLKDFQFYPYVFGSDIDIRAFYRTQWLRNFNNDNPKMLTKGFLDIEADSLSIPGFADPQQNCPVDLVTLIDSSTKTSYTFALVNQPYVEKDLSVLNAKQKKKEMERKHLIKSRHQQERALMDDIDGLKEELNDRFSEHYGHIDYNFYFYDDERKMLVHLFQLVNKLKLDFILIWNISFDMPYMIDRMKVLGLDPTKVIVHPDFPNTQCYFKKDKKHAMPKDRSDYFNCTGYTVWYDQMINYAAIRKSSSELRSTKLTDIGAAEIKDEKLNYEDEGNIKVFPYMNYRKYIIYNIKDVLLQYGIEQRTSDVDTLYTTSYQNATPYDQVWKQTMKLRNVQYLFYLDEGLVTGNNINVFNPEPMKNEVLDDEEEKEDDKDDDNAGFEGALVGNPLLNSNFGMELYGKPSNAIFNYSIDMDMSAFYPNSIYTMNIEASALYFKAICNASQFDVRGGNLKYHGITDKQRVETNKDSFVDDVSKEIFDNFHTRNWISTGHKWLNLPGVSDIIKAYEKEL